MWGPGPPGWASLETENIVMSSAGLGPKNDCAGEDKEEL
jgi:hypothetical protein